MAETNIRTRCERRNDYSTDYLLRRVRRLRQSKPTFGMSLNYWSMATKIANTGTGARDTILLLLLLVGAQAAVVHVP